VVAGEDGDLRAVHVRPVGALPAGEPDGEILEPPERAGGLGELVVPGSAASRASSSQAGARARSALNSARVVKGAMGLLVANVSHTP
jgi:hypothetical protein